MTDTKKDPQEKKEIRQLTELRQDTTEKSQKALEDRISSFENEDTGTFQDNVVNGIAKVVNILAQVGESIREKVPKETQEKIVDVWQKLILWF